MTRFALLLVGCAALLTGAAHAEPDAEGCKDHPLFTRLPNHHILGCDHIQFDKRRFSVGPMDPDGKTKLVDVEGEYWMLEYQANEGVTKPSGLQVQRNYQDAIKKIGGTVEGSYPEWCQMYLDDSFVHGGNNCTNYGTTLKLNKGGKEVWAFVNATGTDDGPTLYIVQRAAMNQDIVANDLLDGLNKVGFVAIYINFDTGKASLQADAASQLDQMAQMLKGNPALRVEVGGHTDNVGDPVANQKLSEARAQTVMQELVKRGIAASRLTAKGYGQTVPIADNRLEDGRAKNRRVELMKK